MKMTQTAVPFIKANVARCMCRQCPVQGKSNCVNGKLARLKDALSQSPLKREDIPQVYCGTGTAFCTDLDFNKTCICGSCPVFAEFRLASGKPIGKYCQQGMAKL